MEIDVALQFFVKFYSIKFRENLSSDSRAISFVRTVGLNELAYKSEVNCTASVITQLLIHCTVHVVYILIYKSETG
jgi:hypothetical protein